MKVNCDLKEEFWHCYNEANGIALRKKRILKTKKRTKGTYFEYCLYEFFAYIFLSVFFFACCNWYGFMLGITFLFLAMLFVLLAFLRSYRFYKYRKSQNFKCALLFLEEGIKDTYYYSIEMLFPWKSIQAVVLGKYSVVILTDTPCFFYFPIKQKNKVLKAIKTYKEDILVVE